MSSEPSPHPVRSQVGRSRARTVWMCIGIVLAALLAIGGLLLVGFLVLMYVAISSYGSNK